MLSNILRRGECQLVRLGLQGAAVGSSGAATLCRALTVTRPNTHKWPLSSFSLSLSHTHTHSHPYFFSFSSSSKSCYHHHLVLTTPICCCQANKTLTHLDLRSNEIRDGSALRSAWAPIATSPVLHLLDLRCNPLAQVIAVAWWPCIGTF